MFKESFLLKYHLTVPLLDFKAPSIIFTKVVLPAPLLPRRAMRSLL